MDHHATVPARPEPVRRVLLVEDHDAYRKVVALALTRFLPRVLVMEAGTAEDAAALVIDEAIDCLVSDFSLPDGTAMDLLNRVPASILQGLRVIVFSNHSQSVMEPLLRTHDIFTCI